MRANCVSGRSRERKFTSPAAFLLSSHDHRADWIDRFWGHVSVGGAAQSARTALLRRGLAQCRVPIGSTVFWGMCRLVVRRRTHAQPCYAGGWRNAVSRLDRPFFGARVGWRCGAERTHSTFFRLCSQYGQVINDNNVTICRRQRLWRDKLEQPYLAFFEKGLGRGGRGNRGRRSAFFHVEKSFSFPPASPTFIGNSAFFMCGFQRKSALKITSTPESCQFASRISPLFAGSDNSIL